MLEQFSKSQKLILGSHKNKITRRELLGVSLNFCAGAILAKGLVSKLAYGEGPLPVFPKFIAIDLIGGAALSGNFLVGGKNGSDDLLSSYSFLGFDPRKAKLDSRFGLPAPKDVSRIFEGIISQCSTGAQSNTRISAIAHPSLDDVDANTTNAIGLVGAYQIRKNIFKQKGLGSLATGSGGRTQSSLDLLRVRPTQLSNLEQLKILSGFYVYNEDGISGENQEKFISNQKNSFLLQFKSLLSIEQSELKQNFEETMDQFGKVASAPNSDPRRNAITQKLFGLSSTSVSSGENSITAGIGLANLLGLVGPSCIALGGFDYHDSTQATGDGRDLAAGIAIGRLVELAHQLKQPLFMQILTDGSCVARENSRVWVGDSGVRSMTLMLSYRPEGPVYQPKTQLGFYTNAQAASTDTYVAKSTSYVANIVFLNYLASMGKESEISEHISLGELPTSQIGQNIAFLGK